MTSLIRPQDRAAPVRMDSPAALFVPPHQIEPPVPAPLYLLEFVPGSLKQAYNLGPDGLVADHNDSYQERVIIAPDGSRCRVEVQGSQALGLPTQFDTDYLLALFRLADRGEIRSDGTLEDPSYRSILRAAGRDPSARSSDDIQSVKRALARWGSVVVATHMELSAPAAAKIEQGESHPLVPAGYPRMLRTEQRHNVLNYEVRKEEYQGRESDSIHLLRINPIWLDQAAAGLSAWVDVDIHNQFKSSWAKRLYQMLAVRAARGWRVRTSWMVPMEELLVEMGVSNTLKPGRNAQNLSKALELLKGAGVVSEFEVSQVGHGRYEVGLLAGELLLMAGHLRGVGGSDPVLTRALLWHLGHLGISAAVGRELLHSHPAQVQTALQYAYYLKSQKRGCDEQGRPVENWGGWLRGKVESGWRFEDPGFQRWIEGMTRSVDQERPTPPQLVRSDSGATEQPELLETPVAPPVTLPDSEWGRVLARIRSEIGDLSFRTWLYGTQLTWSDPASATVLAPHAFAVEWIRRNYLERLTELLTGEAGQAVQIQVEQGKQATEGESW